MNVRLPTVLESYAGGERNVHAVGSTLSALLDDLDLNYPGIRFRMINEQDELRPHMRIFVNGASCSDLTTAIDDHAEVVILQALSGG